MTTAKALAGGMPLAAVTGRAELMDGVHPGGLGGTYGGNPVACAAALAAIDTLRDEDLAACGPRRSARRSTDRLRSVQATHPGYRRRPWTRGDDGHGIVRPGIAGARPRRGPAHRPGLPPGRRGRPDLRQLRKRDPPAAAAGHRGRPAGRRARRAGRSGRRGPRPERPDPPGRIPYRAFGQRRVGGSTARAEARPASSSWISWSASWTRSPTCSTGGVAGRCHRRPLEVAGRPDHVDGLSGHHRGAPGRPARRAAPGRGPSPSPAAGGRATGGKPWVLPTPAAARTAASAWSTARHISLRTLRAGHRAAASADELGPRTEVSRRRRLPQRPATDHRPVGVERPPLAPAVPPHQIRPGHQVTRHQHRRTPARRR